MKISIFDSLKQTGCYPAGSLCFPQPPTFSLCHPSLLPLSLFSSNLSSSHPASSETLTSICNILSPMIAAFLGFSSTFVKSPQHPATSLNQSPPDLILPLSSFSCLLLFSSPLCQSYRALRSEETILPPSSAVSDPTMAFSFYPISHNPACLPAVRVTESCSALLL